MKPLTPEQMAIAAHMEKNPEFFKSPRTRFPEGSVDVPDEIKDQIRLAVVARTRRTPEQILSATIASVKRASIAEFLQEFTAERDVHSFLVRAVRQSTKEPTYEIERVRLAAQRAAHACVLPRDQLEVLYAATIVAAVRYLMAPTITGSSPDDIVFTIARSALHRLDEIAPREAQMLRLCLGWGNIDEVDQDYIPRLRAAIGNAIRSALT